MPSHGIVGAKHGRDIDLENRVNKMPTNSDAGEADSTGEAYIDICVSLPTDGCGRRRLPTRSQAVTRRAGCGSSARPDPWEAWAGNRPGPPDSPFCARQATPWLRVTGGGLTRKLHLPSRFHRDRGPTEAIIRYCTRSYQESFVTTCLAGRRVGNDRPLGSEAKKIAVSLYLDRTSVSSVPSVVKCPG